MQSEPKFLIIYTLTAWDYLAVEVYFGPMVIKIASSGISKNTAATARRAILMRLVRSPVQS